MKTNSELRILAMKWWVNESITSKKDLYILYKIDNFTPADDYTQLTSIEVQKIYNIYHHI